MPLFAAILLDHPPHSMPLRDAHRAEHRAYVRANDGPIRLVGPFLDDADNQSGSFYIFETDSEGAVRDWLAAEPFVAAGVYRDIIVRRFETGMNRIAEQNWPSLT